MINQTEKTYHKFNISYKQHKKTKDKIVKNLFQERWSNNNILFNQMSSIDFL